jgi:hypothetical protein
MSTPCRRAIAGIRCMVPPAPRLDPLAAQTREHHVPSMLSTTREPLLRP